MFPAVTKGENGVKKTKLDSVLLDSERTREAICQHLHLSTVINEWINTCESTQNRSVSFVCCTLIQAVQTDPLQNKTAFEPKEDSEVSCCTLTGRIVAVNESTAQRFRGRWWHWWHIFILTEPPELALSIRIGWGMFGLVKKPVKYRHGAQTRFVQERKRKTMCCSRGVNW